MRYGNLAIRTIAFNLRDMGRTITDFDRRTAADALDQMLDALMRSDDQMVAKCQQVRDLKEKIMDLEEINLQQGCSLQEKDVIIKRFSQDAEHYRQHLYTVSEERNMLCRDVVTLQNQNAALRADLDGTARHAASLENQLKEQQNPKVETKGFRAMVQWRSDEQDDVDPIEVFIAQTEDSYEDEHFVFFYAGDYPEAEIRHAYSRECSPEEWYIIPD
jgi:chromosome segregation ATPase